MKNKQELLDKIGYTEPEANGRYCTYVAPDTIEERILAHSCDNLACHLSLAIERILEVGNTEIGRKFFTKYFRVVDTQEGKTLSALYSVNNKGMVMNIIKFTNYGQPNTFVVETAIKATVSDEKQSHITKHGVSVIENAIDINVFPGETPIPERGSYIGHIAERAIITHAERTQPSLN